MDMMKCNERGSGFLWASVVLGASICFAAEVTQPAFQMKEPALLEVIRSSADVNDRVTACQELCHAGTDAAVPVLEGLLTDVQDKAIFHAALYALQNIPGKVAETALRAAQARCSGQRRDAVATTLRLRATPVMPGYVGDAPPAPASTLLQKGDVTLLPTLVEAASVGHDAEARRTLIGFPSSAADDHLVRLLDGSDAARARFAVGILAERHGAGRFADFVRRAETAKDASLREAYFKSFDTLCCGKDVPALLALLKKFPREKRLIGSVIRVCAREMTAEPGDVEIVSAGYGNFASNKVADVKGMLAALAGGGSRRIAVGNRIAGAGGFARDPAPGLHKELRVTYRFGGFTRFASAPETGELVLAESVLDGTVANALYAARATASGQEANALDSILAALARRGRLPPMPESAFRPLFDGRTLAGWSQQDGYWSVRDGVLTGDSTAEHPCKPNHHLVYTARTFGDFELRAQFRLSKGANSGIQLRCNSQFVGDNGYQADMNGGGNYVGFLYHPRQHLVGARGADVAIGADGAKSEVRFADGKELQKLYRVEEWNDIRVICAGRRIDVWVNGVRTTSVTDARAEFLPERGYIAVQLHQGPPMKVEFRNIRIKE